MNALIFGVNGQDGFYLSELLLANKINVIGVSRNPILNEGNYEMIKGDVADHDFVQQMIKHHQPGYIFHLAANSTTQHSALFENHSTIATGSLNILESVKNSSPHTKVLVVETLHYDENNKPEKLEHLIDFVCSKGYSIYADTYVNTIFLKKQVME